eukprot:471615-Alexandrium_andersonii.AAC.1
MHSRVLLCLPFSRSLRPDASDHAELWPCSGVQKKNRRILASSQHPEEPHAGGLRLEGPIWSSPPPSRSQLLLSLIHI